MFKFTLSDVDIIKNSIPIIAEIIDEGNFRIDQNGLSLLSPDRTMVSVVDFRILSTAFDEYSVDGKEPFSMGLNLANLVAVLKRVKTGDKLTMEMAGKNNKLKITMEGSSKRVFEIPLIEVSTEKPPVDQLNFGTRVEMDSSVLEEGISDADVIGDSVILEAHGDMFKMYSKGDVSSSELEVRKGESGLLTIEAKDKIKSQYPLEYLKKMVKASKLSKQLLLEFGTDYPMRLSFKAIDKMHLSFILAPRISED